MLGALDRVGQPPEPDRVLGGELLHGRAPIERGIESVSERAEPAPASPSRTSLSRQNPGSSRASAASIPPSSAARRRR